MGVEGVSAPVAFFQATEPIRDPKTEFDSPGLELSEYAVKFYPKITGDVTGRDKGYIFDCLP